MTADKPKDQAANRKRAERLAAALKANLKRRKAQSRGRSRDDAPAAPPGEARESPEDGKNR
jgi:hypothetical protein